MRKYEIMFIARPTLSEEEKKNVIAKFSKILTDNKATITGEKDAINEFDRQARNTQDIIRHLITRIED